MNVFITGASSGIGAALARLYAGQGATLGLFARRGDALSVVAAALAPATCAIYPGDVRDADALHRAGADFIRRFGVPDIVIGNAGISVGTLTQHGEDAAVFRAVIDTNVTGLMHTFAPFLQAMLEARRGRLVGIASIAGFRGLPGAGAYSASKAGAIAYSRSLSGASSVEPASTSSPSCPGYIETAMTAKNPYRMPFILPVDRAANLMVRAIAHRRRFYVLPWQMALVGRLLRILPLAAVRSRVRAGETQTRARD